MCVVVWDVAKQKPSFEADQGILRVAASLGAECLEKKTGLGRLIVGTLPWRGDHGAYACTAPLFDDFLRRRHPRLEQDV